MRERPIQAPAWLDYCKETPYCLDYLDVHLCRFTRKVKPNERTPVYLDVIAVHYCDKCVNRLHCLVEPNADVRYQRVAQTTEELEQLWQVKL